MPEGGGLAWIVFNRLSSPAVEKFGLQREVWESLNLRLGRRQFTELVADLDEILLGLADAREELRPKPPKKK